MMRQKAATAQIYALPDDQGFHMLLDIMYKQYATPEARRAAVRAWQSLKQDDKETVKDYIARFEQQKVLHDLRHDPLDEPTLITKVAEGLTSGAGMAARALCDPLTHLDYKQYIDTLVNFATGFESNTFNTANNPFPNVFPAPSPTTPPDRKIQSSIRVQLMAMPTSSRRRGQCYRCGKDGHMARLCRALRPIDSQVRCRSCGSREHRREKCPKKGSSAPCKRCGATGHTASICLSPNCNPTPATPMAMATTEDEDPHLEVVNEVMEIEPMAYSMSTGVGSIDGSSQGLLLSDIIDNKPWRVRLTIGQRPEGASPNEPSPCCHIDGLLDSGAGANFVSTAVVKFALRRNLIDAHLLRTLNPIKITYGNGQTAICTRAIKLPIRFSFHSSLNDEAPSMVWLHCLMVKDTKPSIIVGRPGMATLGVRATIPSWAYKDPTSCSSHDTVLCHSALSTRSTTFEKGTITDTSRIDYDSPTVGGYR
ncbi:hypothetical protein Pmar_PMAR011633 [Perkinsus marinus ATCC 50983]|uniref:CCHC-type domain-containing protein n=1 Tax=Perkinsus marinus (strain ATCC 50983 / TXsc) TaxID=423536 RepID=C5LCB9_PERM5|nr:hypothetical protein Pmar_PMAR011633 [Perkinsus marinus ATCC 50983]EER05602.1 hypothetical protein Pmar_PMAR011633 [Perkinsus marinus ATCC 50983]|eukprot:XP_002773786.1 hypothetical protein Pmar_PMAR011633 [Perkinsus marinus ATCC 50983]